MVIIRKKSYLPYCHPLKPSTFPKQSQWDI
uniref:Uncharacterized protein n=1 Tax=virus sp. ct5rm7 TaxID=2827298 RepID=A0A8S5RGH5_9VIRU|nr:MAG TPA: hypothetical protein [virus sp. ct5rm7]